MAIKDYKLVSREKLLANTAKIPAQWQLPSQYLENVHENSNISVLEITENYDATALIDKISSKQLSSYEVVLAFCKRSAIAHQLVRDGT
jgi:amidase